MLIRWRRGIFVNGDGGSSDRMVFPAVGDGFGGEGGDERWCRWLGVVGRWLVWWFSGWGGYPSG